MKYDDGVAVERPAGGWLREDDEQQQEDEADKTAAAAAGHHSVADPEADMVVDRCEEEAKQIKLHAKERDSKQRYI